MFAEPLSGFRQATARVRRTKADWAIEVAQMRDTRDTDRAVVTLVCDNLNTHTKGPSRIKFQVSGKMAWTPTRLQRG
jgi:hypothetical protein